MAGAFENINDPIDRAFASESFDLAFELFEDDYREETAVRKTGRKSKERIENERKLAEEDEWLLGY